MSSVTYCNGDVWSALYKDDKLFDEASGFVAVTWLNLLTALDIDVHTVHTNGEAIDHYPERLKKLKVM